MVSRLSPVFDTLLRGHQGSEGAVLSLEVSPDTFQRFYQFVYSGAYEMTCSAQEKLFSHSSEAPNPISSSSFAHPIAVRQAPYFHKSAPQAPPKRQRSINEDTEKSADVERLCISSFKKNYSIGSNSSQIRNYVGETISAIDICVGHSRMWLFAYRYSISALMNYACSQLAEELAHWTGSESNFIHTFKALVQHVYINCIVDDRSLRVLLARFAACVLVHVSALDGWAELLTEVPDFETDLGLELVRGVQNGLMQKNGLTNEQSSLLTPLVREDLWPFFISNQEQILSFWSTLVSNTSEISTAATDKDIQNVFQTVDNIISDEKRPYWEHRLAYVQLNRVLTSLKPIINYRRQHGLFRSHRGHDNSTVMLDMYVMALEGRKPRREIARNIRLGKRWSLSIAKSLFLAVAYSNRVDTIIRDFSVTHSFLESVACETLQACRKALGDGAVVSL
ncbi:hypothetical protein QQS21_011648 [Conoideocrella luteorostrata]|uniref:BTB domain-containing protein n=1 Tax=Conoideocrella luteorostrata TaxID=1105319 RepID=A0AAJ0FTI6_9HYPO|nr:hypothetical protein QQS21_011648 [Conoideocrella luteorostrata]